MRSPPARRESRRLLRLVLIVTLLAIPATSAPGQGVEPELPDPISRLRLHRLLEGVVDAADPRWSAIEEEHDRYLAACRTLDAERTSKILAAMNSSLGPDQRALREVRDFTTLLAAEEERLFAAIAGLLGDAALVPISRIRERRDIERLRSPRSISGRPTVSSAGTRSASRPARPGDGSSRS